MSTRALRDSGIQRILEASVSTTEGMVDTLCHFFKSRKKEEDSGDEDTKQFKILFYLWDFRWEMRDGKVKQKGDFASLKNLTKNSGCKTEKATYQHIKRLNAVFKKNGLAIKITGENGNFRIVMET
jgi:hypothetical protein